MSGIEQPDLPMIDLAAFCWKHDSRPEIQRPWSLGEWTYASNGFVAIRVPRRAGVPENPEAPAKIEKLFAPVDSISYLPLTLHIPPLPEQRCATCEGKGWGVKCNYCGGDGGHECDCEYCAHVCDDCGGTGFEVGPDDTLEEHRITCEECDGTGRRTDDRLVHFPNKLVLKAGQLAPILALPGPLEMGAETAGEESDIFPGHFKHPPQFFRGAGWVAVIAPVRYADIRENDVVVNQQEALATAHEERP